MFEVFLKDIVMQFGGAALLICIIVGELIKPFIPRHRRKIVCRPLVVVLAMIVALVIGYATSEPVSWATVGKGAGFCALSFLFYDIGAYSKAKGYLRKRFTGGAS